MNQTCKIHSVTHTYINENILTQICTHTCIEEYKISWGSGRMGEMKWGIWAGKAGKDPSFIHYGVGSVLYTERGGKFLSCWMGWAGLSIVMGWLDTIYKTPRQTHPFGTCDCNCACQPSTTTTIPLSNHTSLWEKAIPT